MSMTDNIRAILLAKGYRPYTLAADLGVSWDVAKRILHGKTPLYYNDLMLIHNTFKVSLNFWANDPGYKIAEKKERGRTSRS